MKKSQTILGLNVQWPFSRLIMDGKKSVETRTYPLPKEKENREIAVIETPGPRGKKEAGIDKARIIGVVRFTDCFQYKSELQWNKDAKKHCVPLDDPNYKWGSSEEKWGWNLKIVKRFNTPKSAPKKKGIVWATDCKID